MIKSYLSIAIRNLFLSKVFSFINIFGLAIGIACALMIVLFVRDEVSFDRFHEKYDSIYRIGVEVWTDQGNPEDGMGNSSTFLGPVLSASMPEIKGFTRTRETYEDVKVGDRVLTLPITSVDTSFFSIFSFPLLQGNPKKALSDPKSIVLTMETATNLFGDEDALGKTILILRDNALTPFVVSGIAKDCPDNSSIQFGAIIPLVISPDLQNDPMNWVNVYFNTFLELSPTVDIPSFEARMKTIYEKESKEAMARVRSWGFKVEFINKLQPLSDLHLATIFKAEGNGVQKGSYPAFSWLLSGIAAFILLIACFNFINLSLARSLRRAKEIGIRKVVGSGRRQLIRQFLGESLVLCAISFCVAVVLAWLLLPLFNDLTNKELSLIYLLDPWSIIVSLLLFFTTGIAAGLYPALVVSRYNPIHILYQRFRLTGKTYLQQGLIVFQFTLTTLLIVAAIVIQKQFNFLTSFDLGFDYHNIVTIEKKNIMPQEVRLYRQELMLLPTIEAVTANGASGMDAKVNGDSSIFFFFDVVDLNYFSTFHIPFTAGRNFNDSASDSANAIVVNESFVKQAGWTSPIGQPVNMNDGQKRQVIGVVPDYHEFDLRQAIGPQAFLSAPDSDTKVGYTKIQVRIEPGSEARSIASMEKTFKKLFPVSPFEASFLEERLVSRYKSESRWKQTMLFAAAVTICISCFGLFGLSLLTAEKKFKEISIRKVLGASVLNIVRGLCTSYLTLVLIALAVSIPAAYYLSGLFLERYPYRIDLSPWIFIGAGALTILLALVTISFQSVRAASTNPANGLRSE